MMNRKNDLKENNILLPLWLLVFWPSPLWLVLIPANYLIDRFVLWWSLGDLPEKGNFCRRHTWKICLAGFLSDFIGAVILFAAFMCSSLAGDGFPAGALLEEIGYGVGFNPFANIGGFLVTALAAAASGACIYLFDQVILQKAGLDAGHARKSALRLALITAPYLYFFPMDIVYKNWL
ncbi:MAG: hypothetical protein Q4F25_02175 [Eubacteriales bacterium]|nr:hypothetical protein [Eubacteriales bacterium]